MKQPFTIGGSVVLRRAISEEAGIPLTSDETVTHYPYLASSEKGRREKYFSGNKSRLNTHYQLPQDWDKAVKAVKDFFAEEEAKPQPLVLKDVILSDVLSIGEDSTFEIKQYDRVDLHLTATHLQQLKAYFNS
jgi:hypothetical protein